MVHFSRRACAITWSAENLIAGKKEAIPEGQQVQPGRLAYFWTFTTPDETTPREILERWNHLLTLLRRGLGASKENPFEFVRVIEPHKSGRRYHLHVIIVCRLPVRWVREKCRQSGFGRIYVERVTPGSLPEYLSKYVAKGRRSAALKGVKLFSCSMRNATWYRVRLVDIEYTEDGVPLELALRAALFWRRRRSQSRGAFALEYLGLRPHLEEMRWRRECRLRARESHAIGDYEEASRWSSWATSGFLTVERVAVCDENGLTYSTEA